MSKITNRDTAPRDGDSVENRLARLLDAPFLASLVPHLPPETLHQLIRSRGLDACGELVTSATPAQLTSLLDLDLWRPGRPGRDGQFDVDRFGEWLEVLVDTGPSVAARTVAALDTDVVVAGLSRYVRVFDPGIFEPIAQSDDEPVDRQEAMREGDVAMHAESMHASGTPRRDWLECEVGGYIVRARRADVWDAIVTLLVALDAEHGNHFHAVMQGCRRLSNSSPEIDGLDDRLLAPEQHLHDVAIERERRRSQQGYATPADARAFLQMARQPERARSGAARTRSLKVNPIVGAYFRAADEADDEREYAITGTPAGIVGSISSTDVHVDATDVPESIAAVIGLLTEAGMMPERPRALLGAADAGPQAARLTRLRRLMECVHDTDEAADFTRSRELAFLGNALLAGCSVQSRPFTPRESSDAAASICNLGLEYWPARWPGVLHEMSSPGAHGTGTATPPDTFPPDSFLIDHDLVTALKWAGLCCTRTSACSWRTSSSRCSTIFTASIATSSASWSAAAQARTATRRRHTVARTRHGGGACDARHDGLDQRARPAGRVSRLARGADSHSRRPHDRRQPDGVRLHFHRRTDPRHPQLHEEAPRSSVTLTGSTAETSAGQFVGPARDA